MKIIALVPAYNPGEIVTHTVQQILAQPGIDTVVLVNDGCDVENSRYLTALRDSDDRVVLVEHPENQGKGFALFTGFRYINDRIPYDYIVTLDSDGQHRPEDLQGFYEKVGIGSYDILVGQRDFSRMPFKSRFGNSVSSFLLGLLFPTDIRDTQSGYRMFSKRFIEYTLATITPGRYETEMKMILEVLKHHKEFRSGIVPIATIYIDDNRNSKFRPLVDGWKVIREFTIYILVALSSFVIDYGLFLVFIHFLGLYYIVAHVLARIISSVYNFLSNKHLVFRSSGSLSWEMLAYLAAVLWTLIFSAGLLFVLKESFFLREELAKPCADLIAFVVNYFILKKLVFNGSDRASGK